MWLEIKILNRTVYILYFNVKIQLLVEIQIYIIHFILKLF